ncbi:MAG: hypothetical protein ABIA63_01415, partial [bacterium]
MRNLRFSLSLFCLILSYFLCLPGTCRAELMELKTQHYIIYYTTGNEYAANEVARVAEEVWDDLVTAFDMIEEYRTIHIRVADEAEAGNGYAAWYDNTVMVTASALSFELRGTSNSLRNVTIHELAHIFSIKKASKNKFFSNLQVSMGTFNEMPDWEVNVPVYFYLVAPTWWSEGIAQHQSKKHFGDMWDTHRDMLLRMAVLEKDLLNYAEMGHFVRDNLHAEMTYNQGFSFVEYLAQNYGNDKVEAMAENRSWISFDGTLKKTFGKTGEQLYKEWKARLQGKYHKIKDSIGTVNQGNMLEKGGDMDYAPRFSQSGDKFLYLTNDGFEYSINNIRLIDLKTDARKTVGEIRFYSDMFLSSKKTLRITSRPSWSPDEKSVLFSTYNSSRYNDLYLLELRTMYARQLTWNMRASDPEFSSDGKKIVFVKNGLDNNQSVGSSNLCIMDSDGKNIRYITHFTNGTQIYSPHWSPDDKRILFTIFNGKDRDIVTINSDAPYYNRDLALVDSNFFPDSTGYSPEAEFEIILSTSADERDAVWDIDGRSIIYASDRGGVFNIYRHNPEDTAAEQITNVIGGALAPAVHPVTGEIYYVNYHAADFSIYIMDSKGAARKFPLKEEEREYSLNPTKPSFEDYWKGEMGSVGKAVHRRGLIDVSPIISFSPALIGDTVQLAQGNVGLELTTGNKLGGFDFYGFGSLGKDFTNRSDVNSRLYLSTTKHFTPISGENLQWQPAVNLFYSRLEYNRDMELINYEVPAFFEYSGNIQNVAVDRNTGDSLWTGDTLNRVMTHYNKYHSVSRLNYNIFGAVSSLEFGKAHALRLSYSGFRLSETVSRNDFDVEYHIQKLYGDSAASVFKDGRISGDESIERRTDTLPNETYSTNDVITDSPFFSAHRFTAGWIYRRLKPSNQLPGGRIMGLF